MIFLLAIIMLLCIVGVVSAIFVFLYYDLHTKRTQVEFNKKEIRTEAELMKIIYDIMERKWTYRVHFHFKLKEIKVPKFEFELNYLVKEIIDSLSPDVLQELKYYYKDEDTVIKTVSEIVQIFLLKYMEEHGVRH